MLAALGVTGTRYQQGYQLGARDGLLEGYARRDREYVVAAAKARADAERAARQALLARADAAPAA